MKKLVVLLFTLPLFFSCEKEVTNIELPEAEPKLVVGCFLSPDNSYTSVTVSTSVPIFGQNNNGSSSSSYIENATVVLSDGINSCQLVYDNFFMRYEVNSSIFPIISGKTYTLSVTASGYKNVFASCTVPQSKVATASATINQNNSSGYSSTSMKIKWTDIVGENNYYRTSIKYIGVDLNNITDTIYQQYISYNNPVFTDKNNDGGELYSSFEYLSNIGDNVYFSSSTGNYTLKGYEIEIANIESNYYLYQKTLNSYAGDNPFAEPSLIYSNIQNGLGVMGAYRSFKFNLF